MIGQDRDVAQRAEREIGRPLQHEADGPLGDQLERRDVRQLCAQRGGVVALAEERLDARLHVEDAEGALVVPAHAAAHAHRQPHPVVRDVPALRQPGAIAAVAAIEQRLVHQAGGDLQRRRLGVAQRHQVRRLAIEVKAQRSAAARGRRHRRR